jgi:outer membrane receptor protein involved in Fe transport
LKLRGGLRIEFAEIRAISLDSSKPEGNLNNVDVLPAINLKYNIDESTHVRASFGKTLARASFSEISPISWYDFTTNYQFTGNLKRTLINNFDIRFEKYLPSASLLSISGFYKHFTNPIEQVMNVEAQNVELSWRNVKQANIVGLVLELKKKVVIDQSKYLNIGFNTSIIRFETQIDDGELELIHSFDPTHSNTRRM